MERDITDISCVQDVVRGSAIFSSSYSNSAVKLLYSVFVILHTFHSRGMWHLSTESARSLDRLARGHGGRSTGKCQQH